MIKTRKLIVFVGITIIVIMGIFPPWVYVDESKVEHPMGYGPIWKPPVERHHESAELFGIKLQVNLQSQSANSIDMLKLLMQIAIVCAVTGGALYLLKRTTVS